jgi:hypothetical protein
MWMTGRSLQTVARLRFFRSQIRCGHSIREEIIVDCSILLVVFNVWEALFRGSVM